VSQREGLFAVQTDPAGNLLVAYPRGVPEKVSVVKAGKPSDNDVVTFNPQALPVVGANTAVVRSVTGQSSELFY
jgi:hypothetical protein